MTAIIVLIVCSLIVAGGFLVAFLVSVKSGQYDDTYSPAVRMLFDDESKPEEQGDRSATTTHSLNENQNTKHTKENIQTLKP